MAEFRAAPFSRLADAPPTAIPKPLTTSPTPPRAIRTLPRRIMTPVQPAPSHLVAVATDRDLIPTSLRPYRASPRAVMLATTCTSAGERSQSMASRMWKRSVLLLARQAALGIRRSHTALSFGLDFGPSLRGQEPRAHQVTRPKPSSLAWEWIPPWTGQPWLLSHASSASLGGRPGAQPADRQDQGLTKRSPNIDWHLDVLVTAAYEVKGSLGCLPDAPHTVTSTAPTQRSTARARRP